MLGGVGLGSGRGASVREKNITTLESRARKPAGVQCEFFWSDFWVEFWKVNFGR